MIVVASRADLATARAGLTGRVGVVMTMGALHAGHAALVGRARSETDAVIVTIFVNPLQFGAGEDLDRYPRPIEADLALCEELGVDLVFAPDPAEVYPRSPVVRVTVGELGDSFEGASRPGHFDGVVTVVQKLLHLTGPDVAYFGQKDAQQLSCIRALVRDLDVPVTVVAVPTVRDADGLALSSRNAYLSESERASALSLSRALATGDVHRGREVLDAEPGVDLDYFERVDPATFEATRDGDLLVVAARVGTTRLIDCRLLTDVPALSRQEEAAAR